MRRAFLFEVETQFVLMLKNVEQIKLLLPSPFIQDCIYSDIAFIQSAISLADVHLLISTFSENINTMSQQCTKIHISMM